MTKSETNLADFLTLIKKSETELSMLKTDTSITIDWIDFKTEFFNDGTWTPNLNNKTNTKVKYPVASQYYVEFLKKNKKIDD